MNQTLTLNPEGARILDRLLNAGLDENPTPGALLHGPETREAELILRELNRAQPQYKDQPTLIEDSADTKAGSQDTPILSTAGITYSLSRSQLMEQGVLKDITEPANEAGFAGSVACTRDLMMDIATIPTGQRATEDSQGRLWDVLVVGLAEARRRHATQEMTVAATGLAKSFVYELHMRFGRRRRYAVRLTFSLGDEGEPVVTLMRAAETYTARKHPQIERKGSQA